MKKLALFLSLGLIMAAAATAQDGGNLVSVGHTSFSGEAVLMPWVTAVLCDSDTAFTVTVHPNHLKATLEKLKAESVGDGLYALPDGRLFKPVVASWVILSEDPAADTALAPVAGDFKLLRSTERRSSDPLGKLPTVSLSNVIIEPVPEPCLVELKGWKCIDGDCKDNCRGNREWDGGPDAFCFCEFTGDDTDSCKASSTKINCTFKDWSEAGCTGQIVNSGTWTGKKCTK